MNPTLFVDEDHIFHSRELHDIAETPQSSAIDIPLFHLGITHKETLIEDKRASAEGVFFTENRLNF